MLSVALHAPSAFPCHEFLIQTPVALPLQLQEHAGQEGLKQPSARQTGWGGQTPHPSPPHSLTPSPLGGTTPRHSLQGTDHQEGFLSPGKVGWEPSPSASDLPTYPQPQPTPQFPTTFPEATQVPGLADALPLQECPSLLLELSEARPEFRPV